MMLIVTVIIIALLALIYYEDEKINKINIKIGLTYEIN